MISTRDAGGESHSYTDVLLSGLANDGGLFVPSEYPSFSLAELEALRSSSYEEIVYAVKRKLVDGAISDADLKRLVDEAYTGGSFDSENGSIVPVTEIESGLFVQNLSLGPTASFKDMAMQLLGREMGYELNRRGERLTILGATSGDTGSAAEASVQGLSNVTLFMLSPLEGMSEFQRAQMGNLTGGNIFNISIDGRFDDCQDLVKAVKQDTEFEALGAVNSINWGRISSQIPYYFAGYFQVAKRIGDEIDVTVPSGNFGNMLSAYIARRMGLPLRRLVIATNENNVLERLIQTGVYEAHPAQITSSPSMDISKASNYERLVFDLFNGDAARVRAYMSEFANKGKVALSEYGFTPSVFTERNLESGSSSHGDRIRTIQETYKTSGVVIDPHTADGVYVGKNSRHADDTPMLCMSTALPVKFEDTVREALGFVPERPKRFLGLESKVPSNAFETMDSDAEVLKDFIRTRSI